MASLMRQTWIWATGQRANMIRIGRRIHAASSLKVETFPLWKSFRSWSRTGKLASDAPQEPRSLPTSGFTTIKNDQLVEEELPDYRVNRFYPVRLGEIFQLARDLKEHRYVALKVYVHTSLVHRELPVYHHIASRMVNSSHQGRGKIRKVLDSFDIIGPHGKHVVLVFEAAQMSLRDMKLVFRPGGFDEDLVKGAIIELLEALDFVHNYGEIVHTDVHPGNMLLGVNDNDLLRKLEEGEFLAPVFRKPISTTRTIYLSRLVRPDEGPMLLSDFGEARIGPSPLRR